MKFTPDNSKLWAEYTGYYNVGVDLGSSMFSGNRIRLTVDKLLPCLQHGSIGSKENVILNNISTSWMALVLVCSVMRLMEKQHC